MVFPVIVRVFEPGLPYATGSKLFSRVQTVYMIGYRDKYDVKFYITFMTCYAGSITRPGVHNV
jgi:hypothetical protein